MMKKIFSLLLMVCGVAAMAQPSTNDIWINEFHYDGVTTFGQSDQNEFVEVVVKRSLYDNAPEFAKMKLVLYTGGAIDQAGLNAGRGLPYNESSFLYSLAETEFLLSSFTACLIASSEYVLLSRSMELQDVPAGFALVYNNSAVVQLLSYEKQFTIAPAAAGGGAASGLTTTVIRTAAGDTARETAQTLNNHSISLVGAGVSYNNFTWSDAITQTATPCAVNAGQTLASSAPLPLRWLHFRASASGDRIITNWLVAEDEATVRYEVEVKGVSFHQFSQQAMLTRQAASGGKYGQVIGGLAPGIYLVRVKAIESDGRFYYSAERKVQIGKGASSLTIYPNPVRTMTAMLQFAARERSAYQLQLIDATGRVVKQQALGTMQANQVNNLTLDLRGILPGTYQIKIRGANEEMNAKLVIAR